jgi:hypothetical protein
MVYVAGNQNRTALEQCQWLYVDPAGQEHGPFPADRIINWERKGFFDGAIEVCKFGTQYWTTLDTVRAEMMLSIQQSAAVQPSRQRQGQQGGSAQAAPSRNAVDNARPDSRGGVGGNAKRGGSVFDRMQPAKDVGARGTSDTQPRYTLYGCAVCEATCLFFNK